MKNYNRISVFSHDDFDAKMMAIDKALANTEKDSFSERIFALENRSFLK